MAIPPIIAKNVTGLPVTLVDLGIQIPGNQQVELTEFVRLEEIWESSSLTDAINNDQILVNDGVGDLTKSESLSYTSPQVASVDLNTVVADASATPTPDVLVRYDAQGRVTLRETSGPTDLVFGPVADGQFLSRSGGTIVGAAPGNVAGPASSTNSAIVLFDGSTGKLLKEAAANTPTVDNSGNIVLTGGTTVGGIVPGTHGSRHNPGGADALSTAAPGTITVGATAAEGNATSFARSNHVHALTAPGAPVDVTKAAASAGASTDVARADHKHDVTTAAPSVGIGAANSEGTSTALARADHNHALREAGGQQLTIGTIADGQYLIRTGNEIAGTGSAASGAGVVKQTKSIEVAVDTSTGSTTFVPFLSLSMTIQAGSRIRVYFSVSFSNSAANRNGEFRLLINGTPVRATAQRVSANSGDLPFSAALVYRQPDAQAAGTYTVAIEWRTSGNTLRVFPVTAPASEHASLLIDEVSG